MYFEHRKSNQIYAIYVCIFACINIAPPSEASCLNQGYSECCVDGTCRSVDGTCYCDQICHLLGDCCDDIADINCSPPSSEYSYIAKYTSLTCCLNFNSYAYVKMFALTVIRVLYRLMFNCIED